jgi:DinB superfamily
MTAPLHEFPANLEERRAELAAGRACLLDAVERVRRATVALSEGQWSLAEIVYHLHLAESLTTRGLQKKLASTERVEPAGVEQLRGEWGQIRKLVGDRRVRVQSPARAVPDGAPGLDEALALLADSRRAFLQAIANAPERDLVSIVLPHPFPAIGYLVAVSWTSVIAFHELRHSEQVRSMTGPAAGKR